MISTLLLAAVLTLVDPAGDAVGDGNLSYPTAQVFRAPGTLDARELSVLESDGFAFGLRMAQVSNPWNLPHGFSLPIIEIYLNTREEGGRTELLPGSGMRLPDGAVWHYAFRLTGESLELVRAQGGGAVEDVTERYDVRLTAEDTLLTVTSNLPRPRHFSLYGVVGSYDPWDPSRWRRVMPEAEAFAFGNPRQAATDIRAVDVLAESLEAQVSAIHSGVLPEFRPPDQQAVWPPVIAAGLVLALLGTAGRILVGRRRAAARRAAGPAPSIGYGAQPAPFEPEPARRLEPVDLLAGLPPVRPTTPEGPGRALPVSGTGTADTGTAGSRTADTGTADTGTAGLRVGVYDAPSPAPPPAPPPAAAPHSESTLDDWGLADDWADERDALWPDAGGSGREEALEVVEAELVDDAPWDALASGGSDEANDEAGDEAGGTFADEVGMDERGKTGDDALDAELPEKEATPEETR